MNRKELIDQLKLGLSTVAGSAHLNDALLRALLAGNSLLVEHYSAIISLRKSLARLESMLAPSPCDKTGLANIRCTPELGVPEFLAACTLPDSNSTTGRVLKSVVLLENVGTISVPLAVFLETLLRGDTASHGEVQVRVPDLFLVVGEQDRSDKDAEARVQAMLAKSFGMRLFLDPPTEAEEFKQLFQLANESEAVPPDSNFTIPQDLRHEITAIKIPEKLIWQAIRFANRVQKDERVTPGGRPGLVALEDWRNAAQAEAYLRGASSVEWEDFRSTMHVTLDHRVRLHARTLEKSGKIIDDSLLPEERQPSAEKIAFGGSGVSEALALNYDEVFSPMSNWLKSKVLGRNDDIDKEDKDFGVNTLDLVLLTLFAGGHILLEDYPGSGKSYLAETLGHMVQDDIIEDVIDIVSHNRIQCTPDLLPSDITGYMMLENGQMRFRRGPVFAYILLLDEINRTTPKVQSSMLQAMAEHKVSIDDRTYDLSELFFVIATQNPLDKLGTYELPYAQLDRFMFKRTLPPIDDPAVITSIMASQFGKGGEPRIPASRIMATARTIVGKDTDNNDAIPLHKEVMPLILNISEAIKNRCQPNYVTVEHRLKQGSQPSVRTLQRFIPALKTLAWIEAEGRGCEVRNSHVQKLCCDWLRHRILPANPSAGVSLEDIIKGVFKEASEKTQH